MRCLPLRPLLIGFLLAATSGSGAAVTLHPGDLVVIDTSARSLVRIEPESGRRETITTWKGDRGKHLTFPWGIAIDREQRIFLSDMNARAIFVVDASTGSRTLVSGGPAGSGPALHSLQGLAIDAAGGLLTASTQRRGRNAAHAILRVDPTTGERRIVAAADVGEGPALDYPTDLAIEPGGTLLVAMRGDDALFRIDPRTGERSVVSSAAVGAGPGLSNPLGLERLANGDVVVTDRRHSQLVLVDIETGDRSVIASPEIGSGPALKAPFGVVQAPDGGLYVSDVGTWSVTHIDLETKVRRVVASQEVGSGVVLAMPRNLTIVSQGVGGPRPPLLWLGLGIALAGAAVLLALARRRTGASRGARSEAA